VGEGRQPVVAQDPQSRLQDRAAAAVAVRAVSAWRLPLR
jgi:hypothetical protein